MQYATQSILGSFRFGKVGVVLLSCIYNKTSKLTQAPSTCCQWSILNYTLNVLNTVVVVVLVVSNVNA